MNKKYIPIESVIYDLSLTIDDRYWNEAKMMFWLTRGARQINIEATLIDKVAALEVIAHKTQLPDDFVYLTQIAYATADTSNCPPTDDGLDGPEYFTPTESQLINSFKWKPMRLTTNPYHNTICLNSKIFNCQECEFAFSINENLTITTTMSSGDIVVAYKGYPCDEDGKLLMPDDETLKEALMHYVLYRYWMSKYQMKEDGAESRMKFHLTMWNTLSKKAMNLNLPDVNQLENLKNIHNKLIPRSNRFQQLFLTLNNRENDSF